MFCLPFAGCRIQDAGYRIKAVSSSPFRVVPYRCNSEPPFNTGFHLASRILYPAS
jgi:hypothetical protein